MYIRPLYYMGLFYVLTIKGLCFMYMRPLYYKGLSYVSRPLYCMGLSYVLCSSNLQELTHAPPIYIRETHYIY